MRSDATADVPLCVLAVINSQAVKLQLRSYTGPGRVGADTAATECNQSALQQTPMAAYWSRGSIGGMHAAST